MKRSASCAAALLIIFLPIAVSAQWLDRIQTESDWEYLYNLGYFDYNTYQIYRELAEGASAADTSQYFAAALGNSYSEINPLPDIHGNVAAPSMDSAAQSSTVQFPHIYARISHKNYSRGNTAYFLLSSNWSGVSVDFKGRQVDNRWEPERRSLNISRGKLGLIVGNYTTDIGLGLGIGHFDYRPVNSEQLDRMPDDFIFPSNSYYNGLKVTVTDKMQLLFSSKDYGSSTKQVIGASVSTRLQTVRLGLALANTVLTGSGHTTTIRSSSVFFGLPNLAFQGEIGYSGDGGGLCLQADRAGTAVKFWHYANGFTNLQASSPAHPDYNRYNDGYHAPEFRQPQTGETGAYLEHRQSHGRFLLLVSVEAWKSSPDVSLANETALAIKYRVGKGIIAYGRAAAKPNSGNGRSLVNLGLNRQGRLSFDAMSSLRFEGELLARGKSSAQLAGTLALSETIMISGRVRGYFDGDYDFFSEEKMFLRRNISFKITYRWQSSDGAGIGPIYLVAESAF